MLYLPVACPGSGKSFVAQKMVEAGLIEADAVVSPDRYREILTGERANQDVNGDVFSIVNKIVFNRVARGLDVYLDATNLNAKLRDKLFRDIEFQEGDEEDLNFDELTVLVSDAPEDILRHRNANRAYPVPDHIFDRFYKQAQEFDPQRLVDLYGATVITFDEMIVWSSINRSATQILEQRQVLI